MDNKAADQNMDPTAPAFRGPDRSTHSPRVDVVMPRVTAAALQEYTKRYKQVPGDGDGDGDGGKKVTMIMK